MAIAKGILYGYTFPVSGFLTLLSIPSSRIKNNFIPYSVYNIDNYNGTLVDIKVKNEDGTEKGIKITKPI